MATASKILALAATQLGVKESPAGSNRVKYNTAFYGWEISGSDYPWCCAFIWWLFREAGASELFYGGGKTASCTTLYNWYKSRVQTVPPEQAKPGDLVFFNFDGNPAIMNHIGVCESCAGGYVTTIDGNTGTDNEANGGAVMRRRRALRYVGGAARPNYEGEIDMTKEEVWAIVEEVLAERDEAMARSMQKVSIWASPQWEKAVKAGVFDGTRPGGYLTREQAAVILDRLGLIKEDN